MPRILVLGRQRQVDLLSLLTSQPDLVDEFQSSQRPYVGPGKELVTVSQVAHWLSHAQTHKRFGERLETWAGGVNQW